MNDSLHDFDKQTENLHLPKFYFIELLQEGSFPNPTDQIYRIKKNDKLRIVLYSRKLYNTMPYLLSSLPKPHIDAKVPQSLQYPNPIEISCPLKLSRVDIDRNFTLLEGEINPEGSWVCDVTPEFSGPLFLQIIFAKKNGSMFEIIDMGKPEWVLVEPRIQIGSTIFSYAQLNIQTILSRSLGPYSRWKDFFKMQANLGYNAFHFAPIQQLGASMSLYSIKDQLSLSKELFPNLKPAEDLQKLEEIISFIERDCQAISFIDILLNHTSFDSEWLLKSSDSYYNPENTPQLASALVLDIALDAFSNSLSEGAIVKYPKGNRIDNEGDINLIAQILWDDVFLPLNIPEYFQFDVSNIIKLIQKHKKEIPEIEVDLIETFVGNKKEFIQKELDLCIIGSGVSKFGLSLDLTRLSEFISKNTPFISIEGLKNALENLNKTYRDRAVGYLSQALENIKGTIRYQILTLGNNVITKNNPLVQKYFTPLANGKYACNNGWIMNVNPLEDFATSNQFHYLRRTIIIWSDLVKLRFGKEKNDSSYLWKHMKEYVKKMAKVFHGFRLDNAHSTPMHVGEYFMRKARKQNNELLVISELFTGSNEMDALLAKKIGFNGLVREAHRCWDTYSLSDALNKHGNTWMRKVGSLDKFFEVDMKTGEKWFTLVPTNPEGILYDVTHDNSSYYESRTIMDCLSKAALLGFSGCCLGTTKGFDEFFESKIDVVNEKRLYKTINENIVSEIKDKTIFCRFLFTPKMPGIVQVRGSWNNWSEPVTMSCKNYGTNLHEAIIPMNPGSYEYKFFVGDHFEVDEYKPVTANWCQNHFLIVTERTAKVHQNITDIRRIFNKYQKDLPKAYPEICIEAHEQDVITVMRQHISSLKNYHMIVRNAINPGMSPNVDICISLPGVLDTCKHIFWASDKIFEKPHSLEFLQGMIGEVHEEFELRKFCDIFYDKNTERTILHFSYMPASFVCILKTKVSDTKRIALCALNTTLKNLTHSKTLCQNLSPTDINYLMFSCECEEEELNNTGTFYLPGKGKLPYGGFGSIYSDIKRAAQLNDLSIPLFNNLREGFWLLDYFGNRLKKRQNLSKIYDLLDQYFGLLKLIPKHDIPNYFSRIFLYITRGVYHKIIENVKIQDPYLQASEFYRNLLLGSYQFISNPPSATPQQNSFSMSAGLPHFSSGWARVWGRDTFIAFKGVLLIPGLYKEAREKILMFSCALRHGIMPNLFDKLNKPRYNCRDACWWYIKAIKDYMEFTNNEDDILNETVEMRFLDDNQNEHYLKKEKGERKILKVADVVHTIFEAHAQGIKFREWSAGNEIDCEMQDEGFLLELALDEETGFIFGGNQKNCLTWMDKMGSSHNAGNRGWPATPRDGAPIEMTGLLKHCLDFVVKYHGLKMFPYDGVIKKNGKTLLYSDWSEKIKANFEKCYYVPIEKEKDHFFEVNPFAVNKRGIYKDIFKNTNEQADYQLRGNGCIAIALAPELFTREFALIYIGWVEEKLIEEKSLGLKTLDKEDQEYISYYNNADDGWNRRIARGYSYHQGPEWVWIYGYFLKALMLLNLENKNFHLENLMSYLANHKSFLKSNDWLSLPEMTNSNGEFCEWSCPAQAWSISCVLEACYDFARHFPESKK